MHDDVVDLRDFYATSLGQVARRMIRRRLRAIWPNLANMRVVGIGYCTPYLRLFEGEAERVFALMPAPQGVLAWPPDGPSAVALADEAELPLPDYSVDRVLLVHAVEASEQVRVLLKEVWRVLAGGGRIVVVVPNRRGIWARLDRTPFGHGHPYTPGQLSRLLREERFTPERSRALHPADALAHGAALGARLGEARRALVHAFRRRRHDRGLEADLRGEADAGPRAAQAPGAGANPAGGDARLRPVARFRRAIGG
jgi:SAM-dependent methyltransferase